MSKLKIEYMSTDELKPYERNAKIHTAEQIEQIKKSIQEFGMNDPIAIWKNNEIIEGHGRLIACSELGIDQVPVIRLDDLTDEQRKAYTLVHNQLTMNTDFDLDLLNMELDDITDIDMADFGFDLQEDEKEWGRSTLSEEFIVPPFSVLDTRKEYWQNRKNAWKSLGIKSELGRDENLLKMSKTIQKQGLSTSIFDPVLCEVVYRWFLPDEGEIYDPFAGGSVRGIVAAKLGHKYTGIELRQEQIDANLVNAKDIGVLPTWYCDDSKNVDKYLADDSVDMVFSCPPYGDLEQYSDDPRDLSNMDYKDFCEAYRIIIRKACQKLRQNRFAVFVVGEIRDKDGFYRNFIDFTTECFLQCGMKKYNELILLDSTGSASLRARRMFSSYRKICKVHQNVLVFYKGDIQKIKDNFAELNIKYDNMELGGEE